MSDFWPYDEVKASAGRSPNEFLIEAPWIKTQVVLAEQDAPRAQALVSRMSAGTLSGEDLDDMSWFFGALDQHYPLAYSIPRRTWPGEWIEYTLTDDSNLDRTKPGRSPTQLLSTLPLEKSTSKDIARISALPKFPKEWLWDIDAAIDFSKVEEGLDPCSLLSLSRRYHLLDALEQGCTDVLLDKVQKLEKRSSQFQTAAALVVRQNHYVTQRCEPSLKPALVTARDAKAHVEAFIKAESGHDLLLGRSLTELGVKANQVPVLSSSTVLMDLLGYTARRNFLAFSLVVDMFERNSYREVDPLAGLLAAGGFDRAAAPVEQHKKINDSGEHENVSKIFLSRMAPVDIDYATEALRLAELTSAAIHSIGADQIHWLISNGIFDKNDPAFVERGLN